MVDICGLALRCESRILSGGGGQVLRPKVADVTKWTYVSNLWLGFGFLMLKYAFSDVLETLSLIFDSYFNTKN